jgi:hypothetical protein
MLELEALDITGEQPTLKDSNCPVVRSMRLQVEQQGRIFEKANQMKKRISEVIKDKKKLFEERALMKTRWDEALSRFLSHRPTDTKQYKKKRGAGPKASDGD